MADFLTPVHKEIDMDKITIERETLERAIADYDSAAGNDGTLLS